MHNDKHLLKTMEFIMKTKLSTIALTIALSLGLASVTYASSHQPKMEETTQTQMQQKGNMNGNGNCNMQQKRGMMHKGMHNGMKGGMKGGMRGIFSQLDLSAEQKSEIQAIMQNAHPKEMLMTPEMRDEKHAKMMALMSAPEFDKKTATEMLNAHHEKKMERKLTMMQARHDAYQVLTDDQKEQVKKIMEENRSKMKNNRMNMDKQMQTN
jgi:Spy/CpxP family protein refolding chaperone